MTWAFWIMFIPIVCFLSTVAYVVARLCDRVSDLEVQAQTDDLIEELALSAEMGRQVPHDNDDLRKKQLQALIALTETRH